MLDRLRRGDPAGLEALMDRYAPLVCAVAARVLPGRPQEWEEVASDVFLAAWEDRKKLRAGQVKGWLATVARNKAFNRRRDRREELPLEEDALLLSPDSPHVEAERGELREVLSRALNSLDRADRELFVRQLLLRPDGGRSGGGDGTEPVHRQDTAAPGPGAAEGVFAGGRV